MICFQSLFWRPAFLSLVQVSLLVATVLVLLTEGSLSFAVSSTKRHWVVHSILLRYDRHNSDPSSIWARQQQEQQQQNRWVCFDLPPHASHDQHHHQPMSEDGASSFLESAYRYEMDDGRINHRNNQENGTGASIAFRTSTHPSQAVAYRNSTSLFVGAMAGGHMSNKYYHDSSSRMSNQSWISHNNARIEDEEVALAVERNGKLGCNNDKPGNEMVEIGGESPTAPEVTHWTELMSGWMSETRANGGTSPPEASMPMLEAVLTDYDLQQIEDYWDRILPSVNYLGTEKVAKIYKALCVSYRAHRGQTRKSGEPFIIHPVEVAVLLAGLRMDGETVIAGLLHDTVEDTELTFAQLELLFGPTVRAIVEGETKVSKLPKIAFSEYADEQAENLRQMFVAMTDDYRIIIVKLADRLHNMRTLQHMKPEKQIKISRETLDIFAPLAHRMGIWQFKSELEDTAFTYLYPEEYKKLSKRLREHQIKFRETLDRSQEILQRRLNSDPTLRQQAAKVEVFGRTKEIYSLWHKMQTKGEHNLENIVDVVALRVVITPFHSEVDEENETDRGVWLCYHVLGLVQHLPGFQPVPTRVKDYISFPKPNGYQSLHTALILNGQTIEVQIRTSMMHQVAEYGMASHWAYTDAKRRGNSEELYNTPWLSSIKEWQNDMISARDFVDSVRRELLGKRVFVFLRNGKILNLARGATAIDAAFQIHTEVGLNMHGVEINGKPVPFSYELRNGDVVSILTGRGKPATDWMRYAKSRSTRSKLRSFFRARQKESLKEAGKILLLDYLSMHGSLIEAKSYLNRSFTTPMSIAEMERFLPGKTKYDTVDDLLIAIGSHHDRDMLHKVVSQIFDVPRKALVSAEEKRRSHVPTSVLETVRDIRLRAKDAEKAIASSHVTYSDDLSKKLCSSESLFRAKPDHLLTELDTDTEYADPEYICADCLPIHGDQIIGTRRPDNVSTATVHRIGCPHAQRAINLAQADQFSRGLRVAFKRDNSRTGAEGKPHVDSVSLRYRSDGQWARRADTRTARFVAGTNDVPVKLKWSDLDQGTAMFLTEVVVHCRNRKFLLADCSTVVSDTVEIVRTGSSSREDYATLVFLVRVNGLDSLQLLMDRLGHVPSVMSVERRFGSELV